VYASHRVISIFRLADVNNIRPPLK